VYPVTTEGRIIATIIMFAGIGILGTFISTVGAKLISEKLKKDVPTVRDDTKRLIKEKINKIEVLNQKDFDLLIRMMKDLREDKEI
jgi:voltage-gated potassium channel